MLLQSKRLNDQQVWPPLAHKGESQGTDTRMKYSHLLWCMQMSTVAAALDVSYPERRQAKQGILSKHHQCLVGHCSLITCGRKPQATCNTFLHHGSRCTLTVDQLESSEQVDVAAFLLLWRQVIRAE